MHIYRCNDVLTGSTTLVAGATSVEDCDCIQVQGCMCVVYNAFARTHINTYMHTHIAHTYCIQGYYLEANATSRSCVACDPLLMDCSTLGITLANMPIKPGGWRLRNTTSIVYECFNPDACNPGVAGSNTTQRRRLSAGASTSTAGDDLCAPGHKGFLCGTCVTDWCDASQHAPRRTAACLTSFTHEVKAWFTSHVMCAEAV